MFTNCFLHSKPIVKVADSRQSIPMNPTYKAQAYQYSQDFFAVKTAEATDFANEFNLDLLDADNVYWLNFHNLDDRSSIEKLGQKIGLDKLSIESIFLPLRRAKVEEYPNYLFFQLHTLRNNSQDTEQTDQITFVLGEHYLLSFQTNEGQHFGEVRERIEKSTRLFFIPYSLPLPLLGRFYRSATLRTATDRPVRARYPPSTPLLCQHPPLRGPCALSAGPR